MSAVQLTIPSVKTTTTDMTRAFYSAFCARYEIVAANVYLGWSGGEMDVCGIRKSGFIDEIEIKLSVSDFKADFNKKVTIHRCRRLKHEVIKDGGHSCNYFSFYLPENLVGKCEIPDYAGLYVFSSYGSIREAKKAPRLHTRKISDHNKYKTVKKMYYRYWDMQMNKWSGE